MSDLTFDFRYVRQVESKPSAAGFEDGNIIFDRTEQKFYQALASAWVPLDFIGDDFTVNKLAFNTAATETLGVGELAWNEDDETVDMHVGDAVTIQLGQEMVYHVINQTGSQIDNGTVVMADGALGASGKIKVVPAIADGSVPAKHIMGVATEDIPNGALGYVTAFGKVRGFDTSSYSSGTVLYASATSSGSFTDVAPSLPNQKVTVAITLDQKSNGNIFVRPTYDDRRKSVSSISDLENVNTTENDVVYLDSGGRSGWFKWDSSPLSAEVSNDTAQGIYVAPNGENGSNGAWVRDFDGPLNILWFGTGESAVKAALEYGNGNTVVIPTGNTVSASSAISVSSMSNITFHVDGEFAMSADVTFTSCDNLNISGRITGASQITTVTTSSASLVTGSLYDVTVNDATNFSVGDTVIISQEIASIGDTDGDSDDNIEYRAWRAVIDSKPSANTLRLIDDGVVLSGDPTNVASGQTVYMYNSLDESVQPLLYLDACDYFNVSGDFEVDVRINNSNFGFVHDLKNLYGQTGLQFCYGCNVSNLVSNDSRQFGLIVHSSRNINVNNLFAYKSKLAGIAFKGVDDSVVSNVLSFNSFIRGIQIRDDDSGSSSPESTNSFLQDSDVGKIWRNSWNGVHITRTELAVDIQSAFDLTLNNFVIDEIVRNIIRVKGNSERIHFNNFAFKNTGVDASEFLGGSDIYFEDGAKDVIFNNVTADKSNTKRHFLYAVSGSNFLISNASFKNFDAGDTTVGGSGAAFYWNGTDRVSLTNVNIGDATNSNVGSIIEINNASGVRIHGLTYKNVSGSIDATTVIDIEGTSEIVSISDCSLFDFDGNGIRLDCSGDDLQVFSNRVNGNTATSGLRLTSEVTGNHVHVYNNVLSGATNALVDSSTATDKRIYRNENYVTENSGFGIISSGGTIVDVSHGLDVTPSINNISVTPRTSLGSASEFWINNVTSTTFRINLDTTPGSQVDFAWNIWNI